MSTLTTPSIFEVPRFPVRRFSVEEYQRMTAQGILSEDEPVELLQGWIVPKMPRNPPHDAVLDLANELIHALLPKGWRLRVQSAITTADSAPESDLAVVRGPASRYMKRHPTSDDIAGVVEVSESSLDRDRQEKGPIYAAARIPWYWIINLVEKVVELYSEPELQGSTLTYQKVEIKRGADELVVVVEGKEAGRLRVQDLLGY